MTRPTPLRQEEQLERGPPPYSTEAEQALLGALLCDNAFVTHVSGWLCPEHFGNAVHARIWTSVTAAVGDGLTANPITLKGAFDQDEALKHAGGAAYLVQLAASGAVVRHPEDYAQHVVDLAHLRGIIMVAGDLTDAAYGAARANARPADILAQHQARLDQIGRSASGGLICAAATPHPITDIPPRPWAYGNFLLFGEAGAIGAVDGGGKGAMATVIALSMITGMSLLGERPWRTGTVAILTYEDDEIEWRRRIAAACLHYKIDYQGVIGSFHFISHPRRSVALAAPGGDGTVWLPDGDNIIRAITAIGAALLIVDPFNHAHELDDGNNNVLIAKVAREIGRIAKLGGTAASPARKRITRHRRIARAGTASRASPSAIRTSSIRTATTCRLRPPGHRHQRSPASR